MFGRITGSDGTFSCSGSRASPVSCLCSPQTGHAMKMQGKCPSLFLSWRSPEASKFLSSKVARFETLRSAPIIHLAKGKHFKSSSKSSVGWSIGVLPKHSAYQTGEPITELSMGIWRRSPETLLDYHLARYSTRYTSSRACIARRK